MYDEYFAKAHELMQKGEPFATATVVRAEAPTSSKPGDKAIITIEGVMYGWIGGSCAQPTVIDQALAALAGDESRLIRLSTDPPAQTPRDGLHDLPMTCFSGGTLEIYIEAHRPKPQLMIIGGLPVAQSLAHLAKAMNYHVMAVDPDHNGRSMTHADEIITDLQRVTGRLSPLTYVVVATHGNFDELALVEVLKAKVPYVGLVASTTRAEAVRTYLQLQGVTESEMLPLKAPAGLDIQARRGDEIALSIMAEIVQKRRNAEILDIALFSKPASIDIELPIVEVSASSAHDDSGCGCESTEPATQTVSTAIDPICHMTVDIPTAKYVHEYDGEMYYFCCAGCQMKFAAEPDRYLQTLS